jgi:hypothetical protein
MKTIFIKIFSVAIFCLMIFVNWLANALPINNLDTGQISDAYPNLFAPAGYAFAIWGLIYTLLGIYVVSQFFIKNKEHLLKRIGVYFIASSFANILWIFAWHYMLPGVSLFLIVAMLVCLAKIAEILKNENLTNKESFLISLPFYLYFGWITVATIANVTIFLVSLGFGGFGIPEEFWTVAILFVGAFIGIKTMVRHQSIAYGLVLVWAYFGIFFKHISSQGFGGEYVYAASSAFFCVLAFLWFLGSLFYKNYYKLAQK